MHFQRKIATTVLLALIATITTGCAEHQRTTHARSESGDSVQSQKETKVPNDSEEVPPVHAIVQFVRVPELPKEIALLDSVFWEPEDTVSLRQRIAADRSMAGASVLEVGTGSGLISLCCVQAGAEKVVATDLNPRAVENARLNAGEMGFADRMDVRLVPRRSPEAWTVIEPEARFDFVISNPPWENRQPVSVDQFALYDPGFLLLKSLVTGARERLKPNGKMWLAYGCVSAVRQIQLLADEENLKCELLDERSLDDLPELFLPGMLIEITVP